MNSLLRNAMSKGALWIIRGALSINLKRAGAILEKWGLFFKSVSNKPWILLACFDILVVVFILL